MSSKDNYEVLETIGTGSFGTVCKIKRKSDGQTFVWKEINFGSMSEREKGQLVSEVNILRELHNPFIVRYHDRIVDRSRTRLYIIMEYCGGGDLGKLINKHRREKTQVEEAHIWKIFAQSIIALGHCHRRKDEHGAKRPTIHRDLKPANMLLDSNGNLKIADFGLAKELSMQTRFASTNVGTPLYMAPEIINQKDYDEKADIWSLGCVLYELASSRPPFDAQNALSLAQKINLGKFARIPPRYSDQLHDAIKGMLTLDPKKRMKLEECEELPMVQSHLFKAKGLIMENEMQITLHKKDVALKAKEEELNAREHKIKAREEELNRRDALITEKERELKVIEASHQNMHASSQQFNQMIVGNQSKQIQSSIIMGDQRDRSSAPSSSASSAMPISSSSNQIPVNMIKIPLPQPMPKPESVFRIHNDFNSVEDVSHKTVKRQMSSDNNTFNFNHHNNMGGMVIPAPRPVPTFGAADDKENDLRRVNSNPNLNPTNSNNINKREGLGIHDNTVESPIKKNRVAAVAAQIAMSSAPSSSSSLHPQPGNSSVDLLTIIQRNSQPINSNKPSTIANNSNNNNMNSNINNNNNINMFMGRPTSHPSKLGQHVNMHMNGNMNFQGAKMPNGQAK